MKWRVRELDFGITRLKTYFFGSNFSASIAPWWWGFLSGVSFDRLDQIVSLTLNHNKDMGIRTGSSCLYSVEGVSLDDLLTILRQRRNDRAKRPVICLDCNWLAMKYAKRSGGPIHTILNIAKMFIEKGVDVCAVVDGPLRHHSKKASVQRRAAREQARFDSLLLRMRIMQNVSKSRMAFVIWSL